MRVLPLTVVRIVLAIVAINDSAVGPGTEMEAKRWIARDKHLNDHTDPFMPLLRHGMASSEYTYFDVGIRAKDANHE